MTEKLQLWYVKIRKYSAGMKQRIAFAQSLLNNPGVIFLDEPTKGLDPLERQKVLRRIKKMGEQGKTVFLSSHLLVEIEQVAHRIAIISNGQVLFRGTTEHVQSCGGFSLVYRKTLMGETI